MIATTLTAGLCGLLFFWLSLRVVQVRRSARIGMGDGGDAELLGRMRAQANFAEYVPLILLLMGLCEHAGGHGGAIHASGVLLIAIRVLHAWGMGLPVPNWQRMVGTAGTWLLLVGFSLYAAVLAFQA